MVALRLAAAGECGGLLRFLSVHHNVTTIAVTTTAALIQVRRIIMARAYAVIDALPNRNQIAQIHESPVIFQGGGMGFPTPTWGSSPRFGTTM